MGRTLTRVDPLAASDAAPHAYAYPRELAALVCARWRDVAPTRPTRDLALDSIETLVSICYQASLLHEEGRPVTFRVVLGDPDDFPAHGGPPRGLHRLVFASPRSLDPQELRRLGAAAAFHRSLIGVHRDPRGALKIWGVVHSGTRWLQGSRGGRDVQQLIPDVLIVAAIGPGRLLVGRGAHTVAELTGGNVTGPAMDVMEAPWLSALFATLHESQSVAHAAARDHAASSWAVLDPAFGAQLARHVLRRVVTGIRGAHHGGMLVVMPAAVAEHAIAPGGTIDLKYHFRDEEPRRRFLALSAQIMNELARTHAASDGPVGWAEYETSVDPRVVALDEALFEVAHMIAAFANADGAVVLTDTLELLGFGGEIVGSTTPIHSVARALDLVGAERELVGTDGVGTRHRSAYRLCQTTPGAVAIAVSQDGGVRFIRKVDDTVTYWDQLARGPWET